MKEYQDIPGVDLTAALGYDRASFLAHAEEGATVATGWVQNINEANVRADLVSYSTNLVDTIRASHPDASVEEVIGGRRLVATETTSYPTTLPEALSIATQTTYAEVPDAYRHTLRLQLTGIDQSFRTFEIAGKRVSLFSYECAPSQL